MSGEEGKIIKLDEDPIWQRTSENAESHTCANGLITLTVIQDNGVIYLALDDVSVRAARVQSDAAAKQEALEWAAERLHLLSPTLQAKGRKGASK